MNRDKTILEIAQRNSLVRREQQAQQYKGQTSNGNEIYDHVVVPADLSTQKGDSFDFYEVAVWNVKKALEDAYEAGRQSVLKKSQEIERDIMNIPANAKQLDGNESGKLAYKVGHRDARHRAVEIVLETLNADS